jgi:hypothetical protein
MKKLETNYAEQEVYRKRYLAATKRGDRYIKKTRPLLVQFKNDLDNFGAQVAHSLRTYVVYRSDGGRFARGLVRASNDLEDIHKAYKASGFKSGWEMRLFAHLFRRKDKLHLNRWVMSIRFVAPDWIEVSDELVEASASTTKIIHQKGFQDFLEAAHLVSSTIETLRGIRIRKILELADRLPYHKAIKLWYYDPWEIQGFLDASREKRKKIFDTKRYKDWRRYPFAGWRKFNTYNGVITNEDIKRSLIDFHDDAYKSKMWYHKRETSGSNIENDYYRAFNSHLKKLENDSNHMYSIYK